MPTVNRKRAAGNLGKVGVLMGGPSSENKISLKSGAAVLKALKESNVNASAVIIKSDNARDNISLLKSKDIDCAFIALHGRFGEDGGIQRILAKLKIPYTGSGIKASSLAMDKVASRNIFKKSGLDVPSFRVVRDKSKGILAARSLGLPLVVKPALTGSSIGISVVRGIDELGPAVKFALKFDNRVIIEEYVKGRELTVGILNGIPLPIIEIVTKHVFFDFKAKYQHGLTEYIVPAKIPPRSSFRVRKAALLAHRLLGCSGCSRVDIILDNKDRPFILEVNTIPGFTSTSLLPKAARNAGIDFNNLCIKLIRLAYEKAKN